MTTFGGQVMTYSTYYIHNYTYILTYYIHILEGQYGTWY